MKTLPSERLNLYTTCPTFDGTESRHYVKRVCQVSRWSDDAGFKGILVYTDNSVVDPWMISQMIIQSTKTLSPLVAVQPVYMHPYTAAKMVSSLAYLHNRQICLNLVAGGFKNDLTALNDTTPHDKRYDRLIEYATVMLRLLRENCPVTFEGEFYRIVHLTLKPALPRQLLPIVTVSGSSAAGLAAAKSLGAIAVKYPEPPEQCAIDHELVNQGCGIRVGIIARQSEDQAWHIAEERFPFNRQGQITHSLAMKASDSEWHRTLSELTGETKQTRQTYWLWPFQNYKTFCPYLVGSYEQVAHEIGRYLSSGYNTFILDVPATEDDLIHIRTVFAEAQQTVVAA